MGMEGDSPGILVSAEVDLKSYRFKKDTGVSWRFIVGKGIQHLNECVPKQEQIALNYDKALRAARYARIMHYLKEKHPAIYDEAISHEQQVVS